MALGKEWAGEGVETIPPAELPAYQYKNPTEIAVLTDTAEILKTLLHQGNTIVKDANGNQIINHGRWIKYDIENRPIRIITSEGTETIFSYDYEGQRSR
ncbi:MAG: hypothetical protein A2252_01145 [Elusimicrobia bacterium RIFOXYA2_FULL_39_19]|nr:MAG: hypothetical protein A2252_01145 [Elusimicrobia bacterium RIFOXYA2_FULL_39_19]